jgi:DNA-binding transcriptional ArsR family regulator
MEALAQKSRQSRTTKALALVISHPLRRRLWDVLSERVASPAELSQQLHADLHTASYHVRVLEKHELVELVRERQVRGAVEHFYRAVDRPHLGRRETEELGPDEKRMNAMHICQLAVADMAFATEAETFTARDDHCVARYPVTLDAEGFRQFSEIMDRALEQMTEVERASARRQAQAPAEPTIRTVAHLMLMELPSSSPIGKAD